MSERDLSERLRRAVFSGDIATARRLIKGGISMNTLLSTGLGNAGGSLLHEAVSNSRNEMLDLLLQANCNINITDKAGNTPLHLACRRGNDDVAMALVKHGAQVNAITKGGRSPLHISVWWGYREISDILLEAGTSVNLRDDDGWTCLHSACSRQMPVSLVEAIIQKGANLNVTDQRGMTPLHRCIQNSAVDIATLRFLLCSGADPNVKSKTTLEKVLHPNSIRPIAGAKSVEVLRTLLAGGFLPLLDNVAGLDKAVAKLLDRPTVHDVTEMHQLLTDCRTTLPRLCHLCRCRVRSVLNDAQGGRAIKQYVNVLPIPELLKDYLVFTDEMEGS